MKWHTLSTGEKDRYYSDYCCHELNFFIAKKDDAYFRETVRPFLQSKMEKHFMDKFLLGHDISAYVDNLDKINVLEKCLLISYLKSNKKVEKAKGIA
jgi:hypothetical protein